MSKNVLAAIALTSAALMTPVALAQSNPNADFPDAPSAQPMQQLPGNMAQQSGVYAVPRFIMVPGSSIEWDSANDAFKFKDQNAQFIFNLRTEKWDQIKTEPQGQGVELKVGTMGDYRLVNFAGADLFKVLPDALLKEFGGASQESAEWLRNPFPSARENRLNGVRSAQSKTGTSGVSSDTVSTAFSNDVFATMQPSVQPVAQQQVQGGYGVQQQQPYYNGMPQQQQTNQVYEVPRFVPVPGDSVGMQWDSARDCLVRGGGFVFNMKTHNWDQGFVSAGNSVNVDRRGNTDCTIGRSPIDTKALYKNLGYVPPQAADWLHTSLPRIQTKRLEGMRIAERHNALVITANTVTTAYPNDVALQPTQPACVKTINGKQVWENPCVTRNGSLVPN